MTNEVVCTSCNSVTTSVLVCPICKNEGLISNFCSQECYETSWSEHSKLHSDNGDKEDLLLKKFKSYKYTGSLRAYPMTPIKTAPKHIQQPDYSKTSLPQSELSNKSTRTIKEYTPQQVKKIRRACLLGRKALDLANSLIEVGVTTDEIDSKVHEFIIAHNGYPSPLNYYGFPKSCCTSVNEVICHGIPNLRPLREGDIVNIDISVYLNGYHGDLSETFFVGEVDDDSKRVTKGAYASLMKAVEACGPGMYYREVGDIINNVADTYKLSVVRSYCGHGIGTEFHDMPNVPHYRKNKAIGIMKPNQVFTIEPMLNLGTYKDLKWPDDWTIVTADGKRSAQFEHTLLVTGTGVEVLTKRLDTSPPLGFDINDLDN